MAFSHMEARMKLINETRIPNEVPKFKRPSEYTNWRSQFEKYLALLDPKLLIFLSTKNVDKDGLTLERKAYDALTRCLPRDVTMSFPNKKTTCELWEALAIKFGGQDILKIQALQARVLNMENEREEMRLRIVGLEKQIADYEAQQTVMTKLKEDHEHALKNIQDLSKKLDKVVPSSKEPVKAVKKKISQFTNYSLQKNKKYLEKSQSTKQRKYQKVDCCEDSGYSQRTKSSVSFQKPKRAFKPTQLPESRKTKSCAYTRAQMFALAPPRRYHMVHRRRKDFVHFSSRDYWLPRVPRTEFRYETTRFNFRWNSISLDYIDASYKRLSKISKTIGTVLKWVPKVVN